LCLYIIQKLLERAHISTLPLGPFRIDTPVHFASFNICSLSYSQTWVLVNRIRLQCFE